MTTPDLSVCPNCGERDFPLVSIERVEAYAPIEREGSPERGFTARWSGMAESTFNWDYSVTLDYRCQSCRTELPEEHAALLDRLLDNHRERDGAS